MISRLRALLKEIEDINHHLQNGCVDPANLYCVKDEFNVDTSSLLVDIDIYLADAFAAIDNVTEMMKEEM